jgi:hypothetical protein
MCAHEDVIVAPVAEGGTEERVEHSVKEREEERKEEREGACA